MPVADLTFESAADAAGFTQVPNIILRDGSISMGAKLVYAALRSHAWQTERSRPGQALLASYLGVSERSIRDYLHELEVVGLVVTIRQSGRRNQYMLAAIGKWVVHRARTARTPGPASGVPPADPGAGFRCTPGPASAEEDTGEEDKSSFANAPDDLRRELRLLPSPEQPVEKPDEAREVFEHWQARLGSPRMTLTSDRRTRIRSRLKAKSVEDLKKAIDGVLNDPHLMGQNDRGRAYTDFATIFKSDGYVERLIDLAERGPIVTDKQRKVQATAARLRDMRLMGNQLRAEAQDA